MKQRIKVIVILLIAVNLLCGIVQAAVVVKCYQPHDFSFQTVTPVGNPYQVGFSAVVTGPNGMTFILPGFFDGNATWKIRISPTVEGAWSLTTTSDLPALNGKTANFTSLKNKDKNIHGVLRVDKEHPHHFIFDDGTRFFMQAYEYDWLWALDMKKPTVPTIEKTLDLLSKFGFNYIILNTFAYDTDWRKGKSGPDDYGPPMLYPWNGTNDAPDHANMNLDYWQHYDRVMTALMERGMQAHILIKVYNKSVNWPKKGSPEEKLFFRWLMARYAAYPNVIWDFSKEAHNEKDLSYKQGWLKYIRATDPYHHLVTVHDDDVANDSGAYDDLTDFRTDQHHQNQKGQNDHETILIQRERRAWPVANIESDYECGQGGLDDKTYGQAMTAEATLSTLWDIAMAGGYTGYYYTFTAWDVIRPFDEPKGYMYMKHFGDFWRSTEYWKLDPSDKLVSNGRCMAQPGHEYVVFQGKAQPFTLDIKGAKSTLAGEWYNPLTGKLSTAGIFRNGMAKLKPPADWADAPLVLYIKGK